VTRRRPRPIFTHTRRDRLDIDGPYHRSGARWTSSTARSTVRTGCRPSPPTSRRAMARSSSAMPRPRPGSASGDRQAAVEPRDRSKSPAAVPAAL